MFIYVLETAKIVIYGTYHVSEYVCALAALGYLMMAIQGAINKKGFPLFFVFMMAFTSFHGVITSSPLSYIASFVLVTLGVIVLELLIRVIFKNKISKW